MRIAFVTCVDKPEGTEDDLVWKQHLQSLGHQVQSVAWSASHEDWSFYDLVVIRSTWDYHKYLPRFLKWAEEGSRKTKLVNSLASIKWNSSKNYLLELPIESRIQSFISKDRVSLSKQIQKMLAEHKVIVMKPTVSATADLTFKVSQVPESIKPLDEILKRGEVILQPFISSILEDGEISLIFYFDQEWKYSHAVRKIAKSGDFRVQVEFGGQVESFSASEKHIQIALNNLKLVPAGNLFARVDLMDWKAGPKIGEIELIEPQLFFKFSDRFAETLSSLLLKT
jgi:glutathione synthase/RimK-type ligase-like ATP-grasp enzyme